MPFIPKTNENSPTVSDKVQTSAALHEVAFLQKRQDNDNIETPAGQDDGNIETPTILHTAIPREQEENLIFNEGKTFFIALA